MRINIRRGSDQIGGSAVEVTAANGERLVLDLGLPLDAEENSAGLLPDIAGLTSRTPDLLGLVISHPHQDHYGLGKHLDPAIPVYMGAAARRIMQACKDYGLPGAFTFKNCVEMKGFTPFRLGSSFTLTPYPVDHAAYDSYALLVEADHKRIFYSGDFRAHGRTAKRTNHLFKVPPKNVDILLLEGSSLDRLGPDARFESEDELENRFLAAFQAAKGLALAHPSSQNIDRLVTIYRAAKRAGRILVMAGYTGFIVWRLENPNIPGFTWPDVKKLVSGATGKAHEITAEQIAAAPDKYAYIVGPGNIPLLKRAGLLNPGACYVYSMWEGYKQNSAGGTVTEMEAAGVQMSALHTSGHADIPTLKELVAAIRPARLVPIHTFHPERYEELFGAETRVERHRDNEEFEA